MALARRSLCQLTQNMTDQPGFMEDTGVHKIQLMHLSQDRMPVLACTIAAHDLTA